MPNSLVLLPVGSACCHVCLERHSSHSLRDALSSHSLAFQLGVDWLPLILCNTCTHSLTTVIWLCKGMEILMRSHGVARSVIQYTVCTYMCNVYFRDICMCMFYVYVCTYIHVWMYVYIYVYSACMFYVSQQGQLWFIVELAHMSPLVNMLLYCPSKPIMITGSPVKTMTHIHYYKWMHTCQSSVHTSRQQWHAYTHMNGLTYISMLYYPVYIISWAVRTSLHGNTIMNFHNLNRQYGTYTIIVKESLR